MDRYERQRILPQIGEVGQGRVRAAHVMIVGCGALGTVSAELLARGGIGRLTIVDRDVVEWTNLQRQGLFDERDAREGLPKAEAARRRLLAVNSEVEVRAVVADFSARNAEEIFDGGGRVAVIVDGTDNFETRYLINDLAVSRGVAWVYGGAVGTVGRVMTIVPGETPCLRCLFEEPPSAGSEAANQTCEVLGVLGATTAVVGAQQASAAMRVIVGGGASEAMLSVDAWTGEMKSIGVAGSRRAECPCCGRREFPFLQGERGSTTLKVCGRNAVQVSPEGAGTVDLAGLAARLGGTGCFEATEYLMRGTLRGEWEGEGEISLTVFPDGRALIGGTSDPGRARSVYAKYVGH